MRFESLRQLLLAAVTCALWSSPAGAVQVAIEYDVIGAAGAVPLTGTMRLTYSATDINTLVSGPAVLSAFQASGTTIIRTGPISILAFVEGRLVGGTVGAALDASGRFANTETGSAFLTAIQCVVVGPGGCTPLGPGTGPLRPGDFAGTAFGSVDGSMFSGVLLNPAYGYTAASFVGRETSRTLIPEPGTAWLIGPALAVVCATGARRWWRA